MMHLLLRRRRNCTRRNPLLGAILGSASALLIGLSTFLSRHDGAHWPVSLAIVLCIAAVAAVAIRFAYFKQRDGQ